MAKATVYMRTASGEVFGTQNPEYHKECENLGSGSKGFQARRDYAASELRKILKPGDTVYTLVRHVSASGMSRDISFYVALIDSDKKPYLRNIDCLMGDVCALPDGKSGGLRVGGCGMDMCFHSVYTLGHYLFPNGFGIAGKYPDGKASPRPANKGIAARYVKKGVVFHGRNGDPTGWDNDGGYALTHSNL